MDSVPLTGSSRWVAGTLSAAATAVAAAAAAAAMLGPALLPVLGCTRTRTGTVPRPPPAYRLYFVALPLR